LVLRIAGKDISKNRLGEKKKLKKPGKKVVQAHKDLGKGLGA